MLPILIINESQLLELLAFHQLSYISVIIGFTWWPISSLAHLVALLRSQCQRSPLETRRSGFLLIAWIRQRQDDSEQRQKDPLLTLYSTRRMRQKEDLCVTSELYKERRDREYGRKEMSKERPNIPTFKVETAKHMGSTGNRTRDHITVGEPTTPKPPLIDSSLT